VNKQISIKLKQTMSSKKLALQGTLKELEQAKAKFKDYSGLNTDNKELSFPPLSSKTQSFEYKEREDLQASLESERISALQSQLNKEKYKPTLDLVGSYAWNARNGSSSEAISQSFERNLPTWAVGIKFSMPLALGALNHTLGGYETQSQSAQYSIEQKSQDQRLQFDELTRNYQEASARLAITEKLLDIQKKKVLAEREKLNRGRSTTFQLLSFEQDYSNTELQLVQTQAEVLGLLTQLKTF
jgi:outer membrane protein TolC